MTACLVQKDKQTSSDNMVQGWRIPGAHICPVSHLLKVRSPRNPNAPFLVVAGHYLGIKLSKNPLGQRFLARSRHWSPLKLCSDTGCWTDCPTPGFLIRQVSVGLPVVPTLLVLGLDSENQCLGHWHMKWKLAAISDRVRSRLKQARDREPSEQGRGPSTLAQEGGRKGER